MGSPNTVDGEITGSFGLLVCLVLALTRVCWWVSKKYGDEMAIWVLREDPDELELGKFGAEPYQSHRGGGVHFRNYAPYLRRYRQLKRARGESSSPWLAFQLSRALPWVMLAGIVVASQFGLLG